MQDYQERDRSLPARYLMGEDESGTPTGYALFNIEDYRNLTPDQQEEYVNELVQFATATGAGDNISAKINNIVSAVVNSPNYSGNQGYDEYNFAVINTQDSLPGLLISNNNFTRDYGDINTETLSDIYSFDFSDEQHGVYVNWLANHEGSHTLGLREAGADFVGAAKALQVNPDGAETLQFIADIRMMHALFLDPDTVGGNTEGFFESYNYGHKTFLAIEHVLDMPPEQIASMSDEDLLSAASDFENRMAGMTAQGFSEHAVHEALWNYNPEGSDPPLGATIMRSGDMDAIRNLAERVVETSDFPSGSYEEQLLGDFVGTMNRVTGIEQQNTIDNEMSLETDDFKVSTEPQRFAP